MGVRLARPEADERVTSCFPVIDDEDPAAADDAALPDVAPPGTTEPDPQ
jgi:hypothetical protein